MARPGIRYLLKDRQSWNLKPMCIGISYTVGDKQICVEPEAWSIQTDRCRLVIWYDRNVWHYDYFGIVHSKLEIIGNADQVYIDGSKAWPIRHQMSGYSAYLLAIVTWFRTHVPELVADWYETYK